MIAALPARAAVAGYSVIAAGAGKAAIILFLL